MSNIKLRIVVTSEGRIGVEIQETQPQGVNKMQYGMLYF